MRRILLVDDDRDVRLILIELLFDAGFEVDGASSFAQGITILETAHHYDLLITDGGFSDGTGSGLVDRARQRGIPSIIVTGYPPESFASANCTVLAKPLRRHVLLAEVNKAFAKNP
jgi:CheY-like chemotaxis protein